MKFTFGRQQSDSSLISAVKKGDKGAYEQLFVRYYPTLLRFIHGMLKDRKFFSDRKIFPEIKLRRCFSGTSRSAGTMEKQRPPTLLVQVDGRLP